MNHIKILDVFYGNKCNLACKNCDTRSDVLRTTTYDPELDTIKESIFLANNHFDVENWSILGGEPLLYKDKIVEIISYLRSIEPNKTIFLSTNGLLLDKNINFVVELIKKYKIWVQVCNHTAEFMDITKIQNNVHAIGNAAKLPLIEPAYLWWDTIMSYKSGTKEWQEYLDKKQWAITTKDPNAITYMQNNYGIHYVESREFQTTHNIVNGKPMPFDEDPQEAYTNSCPSQFCSFLYNKKIYKCAALGTLRNLLEKYNMTEEPAWQKYLNYKPVSLETCSKEDINWFSKTHYCSVSECSMCPGVHRKIVKDEINVLPIHLEKR